MTRRRPALFSICLLSVTLAGAASGSAALAQAPACFDAEATVRILRQTPTIPYDCGDCIVMSWPWIVDLDIRQVHWGDLEPGPVTVLTVQHTYFRPGAGRGRWLFRRNAQGGFNATPHWNAAPGRCPADAPLPDAFLVPVAGQSLDDARRAGEARFGAQPALED
ncbi:MAG: hypothetical protein KIS81_09495 [Maricaulaceae bacterium]|nr:hypothetical protein [Maricaulaceae bacterium]